MESLCDSYLKGQEAPSAEMTENVGTMSIEENEWLAHPQCFLTQFSFPHPISVFPGAAELLQSSSSWISSSSMPTS